MNENQQNLSNKENKKFIKIMRENLHTLRETLPDHSNYDLFILTSNTMIL